MDAAGGTRVDRIADAFGPLRKRGRISAGRQLGGLRTADAEYGGRDEHRYRNDDRGDANDGTAGAVLEFQKTLSKTEYEEPAAKPFYLKANSSEEMLSFQIRRFNEQYADYYLKDSSNAGTFETVNKDLEGPWRAG